MERFQTKLRKSRRAFGRESQALLRKMQEAGESFADQTRRATRRFSRFVGTEARSWTRYVHKSANEALVDARGYRDPRQLQLRLLQAADATLLGLDQRVRDRLTALSTASLPPALPFEGYEKLTARAIVSRLTDLEPDTARIVLEFERQTKKRTTVLKAAEQRLAA